MEKKEYKKLRSSYDFLMGMLWIHKDFKDKMREPIMEDLMSFMYSKLDEEWKK